MIGAGSVDYEFYEPSAIYRAREALAQVFRSRRAIRSQREKRRTTWYEFQELRITRDWLWSSLGLRVDGSRPQTRPIYSFALNTDGVRYLVSRPHIVGASQRIAYHCWSEPCSDALVLHAEGEVDLSTASQLEQAIRAAFAENRPVIVDLGHLDYLDGSGIRVLLRVAEEKRGRFVVVGSKPAIHRLFDILELNDVLPVVASVEEAREHLNRLQ